MLLGWIPSQRKEAMSQVALWSVVVGVAGWGCPVPDREDVFGYGAYSASKHALKGLGESHYYELGLQGVTVQLVCPPEIESPMTATLDTRRTPENAAHMLMIPRESLSEIVRDTLKAIHSGRYQTLTGTKTRLMGVVQPHFPSLSRAVARQTIRRAADE